MRKAVIRDFARYCSYTNRVRWANYISYSCKFPVVHILQKLVVSRQSCCNYNEQVAFWTTLYKHVNINKMYVCTLCRRRWSCPSQRLTSIVHTAVPVRTSTTPPTTRMFHERENQGIISRSSNDLVSSVYKFNLISSSSYLFSEHMR